MKTVVIALDISGSTARNASYEANTRIIVKRLRESNADANFVYIVWSSWAKKVSYNEFMAYTYGQRDGGTEPSYIVALLPEDSASTHFCLITDGQISSDSVRKCATLLGARAFRRVDVHFLNTGGGMDLSVAAPFICKTEFALAKDLAEFSAGSTVNQVDLESYFHAEPEVFLDEWTRIRDVILAQNLVTITTATAVYDRLLALQAHLLRVLSLRKTNNDVNGRVLDMIAARSSQGVDDDSRIANRYEEILPVWKAAVDAATIHLEVGQVSLERQIEAIIQELLRLCKTTGNFSFSQFDTSRITRAAPVAPVAPVELPTVETENKLECIISLEQDVPVLLINDGDGVLAGLEKGRVDSYMTNPLGILFDSTLVAKIRDRLDHPLGLESIQAMSTTPNGFASPMTRARVVSYIPTGANWSHAKATNAGLASIFFGTNKLVGQADLWLYVVYSVIESLPYLHPFLPALAEHMRYRASTLSTNITFSGLPIPPAFKGQVALAVFHCLASPIIYQGSVEESNRLCGFGASAAYLVKYAQLLRVPFDEERTQRLIRLYGTIRGWLRYLHPNATPEDKERFAVITRDEFKSLYCFDTGTAIYNSGRIHGTPSETFLTACLLKLTRHDSLPNAVGELKRMSPLFNELLLGNDIATNGPEVVDFLNASMFRNQVLPEPKDDSICAFATPYGCSSLYFHRTGQRFVLPSYGFPVEAPIGGMMVEVWNTARKDCFKNAYHVTDVAPCSSSWIYNGVLSTAQHYNQNTGGDLGTIPKRVDTLAILKRLFADGRGFICDPKLLTDIVLIQFAYLARRAAWLAEGRPILNMLTHRVTYAEKVALEVGTAKLIPAQYSEFHAGPVRYGPADFSHLPEWPALVRPLSVEEIDLVFCAKKWTGASVP